MDGDVRAGSSVTPPGPCCRRGTAQPRRGLTLVELLVVVAIVALLLMLLFPAVQSAREAARATVCRNNLRQMGIALTGYAAHTETFPNGATGWWRKGTTGPWVEWGGSWVSSILPFAEEKSSFEGIRFGCAGSGAGVNGLHPIVGCNDAVLLDYLPAWLTCPSSPLPRIKDCTYNGSTTRRGFGTYAGVAGGAPDARNPARVANQACFGGFVAANGILYPASGVAPAAVRDGLSNTMIVGEQSGYLVAADGSVVDSRSANSLGSLIGANEDQPPCSTCTDWTDPTSCVRAHAVTTVRYRLGWQNYVPWAGMGTNGGYGPNTPIQSVHGPGANVGFADGSVRWLADDIDQPIFLGLAIRDDGMGGAP